MCGTNGVLYPNECFLEYDNCVAGGGIVVKYPVDCRMSESATWVMNECVSGVCVCCQYRVYHLLLLVSVCLCAGNVKLRHLLEFPLTCVTENVFDRILQGFL